MMALNRSRHLPPCYSSPSEPVFEFCTAFTTFSSRSPTVPFCARCSSVLEPKYGLTLNAFLQ